MEEIIIVIIIINILKMNKKIINKTNKREKNINIINKLTQNLNQVTKIILSLLFFLTWEFTGKDNNLKPSFYLYVYKKNYISYMANVEAKLKS